MGAQRLLYRYFTYIPTWCNLSGPFTPTACGSTYLQSLYKTLCLKTIQWTQNMWKHYTSIKAEWGRQKVIILKFDYHEKDIGSTMSNQLEG